MSTHSQSSANVVGVHYRVGKKIGEGSFGVIFEGQLFIIYPNIYSRALIYITGVNLLNQQPVAIKFVRRESC